MSLTIKGVWNPGLWGFTVWANGVWHVEGTSATVSGPACGSVVVNTKDNCGY